MQAELEQMYMALKLGCSHLKAIAAATTSAKLSADLERSQQLIREAAELLGSHIDPDNLSILRSKHDN